MIVPAPPGGESLPADESPPDDESSGYGAAPDEIRLDQPASASAAE
jgi:hypothetical protein